MIHYARNALLAAALLFAAFAVGTLAQADPIYVAPATGSGVSDADLGTATELIKTSVSNVGGGQVVSDPGQADFTLQPKLLRLGEAYILALSKIDKHGQIESSTQLKAARMDELDKVADRVTRSVLLGENAKETPRVGEITNQEASDGNQRRPTRNERYLGFGGAELSNLGVSGIGYSFGAAYAWDMNTALLKIMGEFAGLSDALMLSAGIGAQAFLYTTDIAPYLGGDFGGGVSKASGGGGFFSGGLTGGFELGATAGVEFFRSHAVNLDVGFRAGFLLNSNSIGSPQAYTLRLGLYF